MSRAMQRHRPVRFSYPDSKAAGVRPLIRACRGKARVADPCAAIAHVRQATRYRHRPAAASGEATQRPAVAGQRPFVLVADRLLLPSGGFDLGLLFHLEPVVDLDPELTNGSFGLGMVEQELDGSAILGATIDHRRSGPMHRVRPIRRGIETDFLDPVMHDSGILPGAEVGGRGAPERDPVGSPGRASGPARGQQGARLRGQPGECL